MRGSVTPRPPLPSTAAAPHAAGTQAKGARAEGAVAVISDSLFDHSEDVDFVLDPVTLRQGRAHTASRLPRGVQGEQAVITF